jgi:hypothetical protein
MDWPDANADPAAQAQEAVGQDAAFQESIEFIGDEPKQRGAGAGPGIGDEAWRMPPQRVCLDEMKQTPTLPMGRSANLEARKHRDASRPVGVRPLTGAIDQTRR